MSLAASLARLENVVLIFKVPRELGAASHARLQNAVLILKVSLEPFHLPGLSGKLHFDY